MICDIIFMVSTYLETKDKVNLLQLDKEIYNNSNHFLTIKEYIHKSIFNDKLNIEYISTNEKYILHLICKYNKVNILKQDIYWNKLNDTYITDDDYENVFYNKYYDLFILLNKIPCSKIKKINNIYIYSCKLGLIQVIISILGHDRLDTDYCDGLALHAALESGNTETIKLIQNELEWKNKNRSSL